MGEFTSYTQDGIAFEPDGTVLNSGALKDWELQQGSSGLPRQAGAPAAEALPDSPPGTDELARWLTASQTTRVLGAAAIPPYFKGQGG